MILSLLLLSLLTPILGTVVLSYAFERFVGLRPSLSVIVFIIWLPLYVWIIQLPNVPPKQALDWIWIYIIFSSIGMKLKTYKYKSLQLKSLYQAILFIGIGSLVIWPAISYNASISSHWLIWLESLTFAVTGMCILFMFTTTKLPPKKDDLVIMGNIHLWLFTGSLGFTVILSGSLLIGELLLALSSIFFTLGLYCKFRKNFKINATINELPVLYSLALLFLLISMIYVEVDIINTVILMFSIILSSFIIINKPQNKVFQIVLIACLCTSMSYSFYTEVINVPNNGYY
jgi:hypothetical protein